jgi:hypothetical protein
MDPARRDWELGSREWLHWAAGLPGRPLYLSGQAGSQQLMTGRLIIKGLMLSNSATAAGLFDLIDGSGNNGNIFASVTVPASGSVTPTFGAAGLLLEQGLYFTAVTGAFTGGIYVVPLWDYPFTPVPD